VEETAVIKENLLSTDHVQQSLALVSQFFINTKILSTKRPLIFLGIFYYYL
jgi:hypothetical protein